MDNNEVYALFEDIKSGLKGINNKLENTPKASNSQKKANTHCKRRSANEQNYHIDRTSPCGWNVDHASQKHNLQRQHFFQSELKEHIRHSNAENHSKRSESW